MENGSLSEYIVIKGNIHMNISKGGSFVNEATAGFGIMTVGQCLYGLSGLGLTVT